MDMRIDHGRSVQDRDVEVRCRGTGREIQVHYNEFMATSSSISLSALVELCRVLRHNLDAGLSLLNVFRQQAKRGPSEIRGVAEEIAGDLAKGRDLEHALEKQR